MEAMTTPSWRKASYSDNGGNCVEVADHNSQVLVRDTQDRAGEALKFTPTAWRTFASQLKRS
jgi:Domain of unknown function (DUF397)